MALGCLAAGLACAATSIVLAPVRTSLRAKLPLKTRETLGSRLGISVAVLGWAALCYWLPELSDILWLPAIGNYVPENPVPRTIPFNLATATAAMLGAYASGFLGQCFLQEMFLSNKESVDVQLRTY